MRRGLKWVLGIPALGLLWLALLPPGTTGAEEPAGRTVQIGLAKTLFRDTPPSLINVLSRPLKALMESQTGVSGNLQVVGDAHEL